MPRPTPPPVFIIVANNTSSSKPIYDYISGFEGDGEDGEGAFHAGRYPLFRNHGEQVVGIPFDFTAKPVNIAPSPPKQTVNVQAVRPDRDGPELTPDLVGPSSTRSEGIIGEGGNLTLEHLQSVRRNTIIYELTRHLLYRKFRDAGEEPKLHLFGRLKRIVTRWMDKGYLVCTGGTYPAQLLYAELAAMAAERIFVATRNAQSRRGRVKAVLDAYNPTGSTARRQSEPQLKDIPRRRPESA